MNKNKIIGIISIALIVVVGMIPTNLGTKIVLIAFILGFDFYLNRALLFFVQANRHILNKKGNTMDKAWNYYRKAFDTGKLDLKYLVTMGNVLAQRGDPYFSIEVLDKVIKTDEADKTLKNQARVQKSMALERLDKIDEAIDILQEAREQGYKDKSLYINLGCYLLFNDDIDEAIEILDESAEFEKTNAGSLDNRGWLYIAQGKWDEAAQLYNDMMDRKPAFPDPYVHAVQVKLHYGKRDEAITLLKASIEKKWNSASFFNQDIIKEMIKNLEDENNSLYISKFNASFIEIAKGLDLKEVSDEEAEKLAQVPFKKEPENIKSIESDQTDESNNKIEDDVRLNTASNDDAIDDGFPNTELTEEDLKWEENHNK